MEETLRDWTDQHKDWYAHKVDFADSPCVICGTPLDQASPQTASGSLRCDFCYTQYVLRLSNDEVCLFSQYYGKPELASKLRGLFIACSSRQTYLAKKDELLANELAT